MNPSAPHIEPALVGEPGPFIHQLPDRILTHFEMLRGEHMNEVEGERLFMDRYEHCLQTATRALRAGADDEFVVCALLHDIGDVLGSCDHGAVSAAILAPFVGDDNLWMVANHARLQRHHLVAIGGGEFNHYIGLDQEACAALRNQPFLEQTMRFCNEYDQPSYDPSYPTLPIAAFEPLVRRIFCYSRARCYDR